jgi:hypothetical protein
MNCTTIEQSKKLIEFGLSSETADMWWTPLNWQLTEYYVEVKQDGIGTPKNPIPCWSLGALMELMPKIKEDEDDGGCYPTLCKGYNTDKWHCVYRSSIYITNWYDTSIDAAFEMVVWLLENGYIKKGE